MSAPQPSVPEDSIFKVGERNLLIKGRVNSQSTIIDFKISNQDVLLDENGYFVHQVAVPYGVWHIPFDARNVNNKTAFKELITERILNKDGNDVLNNSRYGKDYALIIATDEFDQLNDLSNPVFDATTVKSELEENYGFESELLLNATKNEMLGKIRDYGKKKYNHEDQLFIFVAGHGVFDEIFKEGYIASKDSKKNDAVKDSYISYANFRNYVNNIECKHIFIVLDVCFGGTFNPLLAKRGVDEYNDSDKLVFIKRKLKYTTRRYMTSGGKTYVPDGVEGHHSPFARRFIEALRNYGGEDGILNISEIVQFVERAEPEPTHGEFGINEPGSDFLFINSLD